MSNKSPATTVRGVLAVAGSYAWWVLLGRGLSERLLESAGEAASSLVSFAPLALLWASLFVPYDKLGRWRLPAHLSFVIALFAVCILQGSSARGLGQTLAAAVATIVYVGACCASYPLGASDRMGGSLKPGSKQIRPIVTRKLFVPAPGYGVALTGLALGVIFLVTPFLQGHNQALASAYPGRVRTAQATMIALGVAITSGVLSVYLVPAARALLATRDDQVIASRMVHAQIRAGADWTTWLSMGLGLIALLAWWLL